MTKRMAALIAAIACSAVHQQTGAVGEVDFGGGLRFAGAVRRPIRAGVLVVCNPSCQRLAEWHSQRNYSREGAAGVLAARLAHSSRSSRNSQTSLLVCRVEH